MRSRNKNFTKGFGTNLLQFVINQFQNVISHIQNGINQFQNRICDSSITIYD